jgi:hypothetical protein
MAIGPGLHIINYMMHHIRVYLGVFVAALALSAAAEERVKYSELQIKDYDEMREMMNERIKNAHKILKESDKEDGGDNDTPDAEAVEQLRNGLILVLSRPNQDNMLGKLMPDIRKELSNLNSFEDTLASIASEALDGLANDKLKTVQRSTYWFILENILSEFKPEAADKDEFKNMFIKIRDARLDVPKQVTKDLKLRSMFKVESPSERAKRILEGFKPAGKDKKGK